MGFDEKMPEDNEVTADGVRVLVDPKAKGTCGCGESVSFDL